MINYDSSLIYVASLENNNRGVFAKQNISKNTVVEIFPIVPLKFRTVYQFDANIIHYSYINDTCKCQECEKHGSIIYFPLGYGGIYNYASNNKESNISIKINYEKFYGETIAIADISKDEELISNFEESYIYRQINSQK